MSEVLQGLDTAPKPIRPVAPKRQSLLSRIFRRGAQPKVENVSIEARRADAERRKANILAFPDYRVGPEDNRLIDKINAELKELDAEEGKNAA